MQVVSKKPVKYDPTLVIVELLLTKLSGTGSVCNFCLTNKVIYNVESVAGCAVVITLRCTESQLTEIILHFG